MIIHNMTVIQTEFCLLDADGNVTERKPMQTTISRFCHEEFEQAFELLLRARQEWEEQCQAQSD